MARWAGETLTPEDRGGVENEVAFRPWIDRRSFESLIDELSVATPQTVAAAFDRDQFVSDSVTFQLVGHRGGLFDGDVVVGGAV